MWIIDWTTRAACKGTDPDELFVQGAAQNRTKLICRGCPVRTECLADALDNMIEFGVWGGMTERERRYHLRTNESAEERFVTFSWRTLLWLAMRRYLDFPPVDSDPPALSRNAEAALQLIQKRANRNGAWANGTADMLTRIMCDDRHDWTADISADVLDRLQAVGMIAVIKVTGASGKGAAVRRGGIQVLVPGFEYLLVARQRARAHTAAEADALAEAERVLDEAQAAMVPA